MVTDGVLKAYDPGMDGRVWRELQDEIPDDLVDAHVHCFRPSDQRLSPATNPSLPIAATSFSFERCERVSSRLWQGKRFRCVAFNMPAPNSNTESANRWVAREARQRNWPSLAMIRPEWGSDTVEAQITSGGHAGVKPYWNYVTHKAQNDVLIEDMMDPSVPGLLESLGRVLLLHIPRAARLADPANLASLHRLCRRHPRLTVVLAHAGRSYGADQMPPIAEIRRLARHENLWIEFSMVQSAEVVKMFLRIFGWRRCLFGTDLPVAELKGKVVTVNGQNLFVTRKPYPWSVSPVGAVNLRCTFFAYEIVRAIVTAMKELRLGGRAREAVFHANAAQLYATKIPGRSRSR
jgi:glutamate-1-semialdehyde 2,1-aminomutase